MLNQETVSRLAEIARLKPEELSEAIKSEEEKSLELPKLNTFTDDEIQARVTNTLKEAVSRYSQKELDGAQITGDSPEDVIHALGKRVYDDSKSAALEMTVKNWKEKNGADFSGRSIDDLVSYIKSQKADTGELETTIEGLRQNLTGKETEIEKLKSDYEKRLSGTRQRQEVASAIPPNLVDTIKPDHVLQLFLATHEMEDQNGKTVVKKNGEVIKDAQLLNPKPLDVIVKEFVDENGWTAVSKTGRGGADHKAPITGVEHITDMDSFHSYLKDQGIHRNSLQAVGVFNKLPKEVQDKLTARS